MLSHWPAPPLLFSRHPTTRAFLVGLNLLLTYLNYRGLHVVGNAAIAMTVITLAPFLIMTLLGLPHIKIANLIQVDLKTVKWFPFFNVMFWCAGRVVVGVGRGVA